LFYSFCSAVPPGKVRILVPQPFEMAQQNSWRGQNGFKCFTVFVPKLPSDVSELRPTSDTGMSSTTSGPAQGEDGKPSIHRFGRTRNRVRFGSHVSVTVSLGEAACSRRRHSAEFTACSEKGSRQKLRGAWSIISLIIASGTTPAASPSKFKINRCLSAG
jgi:hypothetical protein